MKILWICNGMLPEIARDMNFRTPEGGGWMSGIMDEMKEYDEHRAVVCFPYTNASICGETDGIRYYSYIRSVPTKYNKENENRFNEVISIEKPDVVQIWGTEYPHSLAAIKACEKQGVLDKTVIHIQGLVSVYSGHYCADLPARVVYGFTLRDLIKNDNVKGQARAFEKRGKFEVEVLKKAKHIMGRTDWDRACIKIINPSAKYHHCNESLREVFYSSKWKYAECEKHSVFVSQSYCPIKGLHKMIEAMAYIVKEYPDAHLYTTGPDLMKKVSFLKGQRNTYYFLYLKKIIKKYGLENNITFLGRLTAEQMKDRYLKSNVFVSASSIENSPNSLGEAMILGVPCVSSDVGGVRTMMQDGKDGYIYQFDAPYMLSYYVCKLFEKKEDVCSFSDNARLHALDTHNRKENFKKLISIYEELAEEKL